MLLVTDFISDGPDKLEIELAYLFVYNIHPISNWHYLIKHLKSEVHGNKIYKFSLLSRGNHTDSWVGAVQQNNGCLL